MPRVHAPAGFQLGSNPRAHAAAGNARSTRKHCAHLSHDRVRVLENIAGREAKQLDSRHEQAVLTAVVLGQAEAMTPSVVFESQPMRRVVEIRAREKSTVAVLERYLSLRAGQAAQHDG